MKSGIVDTVLEGQGKYIGKAYFFKGNQYVRYDWERDRVDDGYPLPITGWNLPYEFTDEVDAALNGQSKYTGKEYFFKRDRSPVSGGFRDFVALTATKLDPVSRYERTLKDFRDRTESKIKHLILALYQTRQPHNLTKWQCANDEG